MTASSAVAGKWVGRLVDPATQEREMSGVAVIEVPVVDESKREGEIVAQDPAPGQPLRGQITLTVVRKPGKVDLLACCTHTFGERSRSVDAAVGGYRPPALRHHAAVELPLHRSRGRGGDRTVR